MKEATYSVSSRQSMPLYTFGEEIFNAVSHIAGGAFGIAMLAVLLPLSYPDGGYMLASLIFGISVVVLYTMSALYHFLPSGKAKQVFRVFDHCTIFLLIAGTYTPYCVMGLGGTTIGVWILASEWILAAIGITGNAIAMRNRVVKTVSMLLYCVMGWLILIAVRPLVATIGVVSFCYLLLGGVAYTVGIVFYGLGKKVKYFHAIWHLFDIAGTILQCIGILLFLV